MDASFPWVCLSLYSLPLPLPKRKKKEKQEQPSLSPRQIIRIYKAAFCSSVHLCSFAHVLARLFILSLASSS